jgi:hypothetical protein
MTHLGYNCIQRQGAVAAEKLDDDPASTRMGAGVRRTHSCVVAIFISCEMQETGGHANYPRTSLGTKKPTWSMKQEWNP